MTPSAATSERSSQRFYAKLGSDGLADLASDEKTHEDVRLAKRLCRGARDVLDLACGYGRIAVPMARAGWNMRGIDLSRPLILAARRLARGERSPARFDVGSMLDLPYTAASFDRVLCLWSSFNHLLTLADQRACVAEMLRVLRPGGRAYIESVDAGLPSIRRRLAREGFGPGRRLATWTLGGATITHFFHDHASLTAACSEAPRARIGWTAVHGVRRLSARLQAARAQRPKARTAARRRA